MVYFFPANKNIYHRIHQIRDLSDHLFPYLCLFDLINFLFENRDFLQNLDPTKIYNLYRNIFLFLCHFLLVHNPLNKQAILRINMQGNL